MYAILLSTQGSFSISEIVILDEGFFYSKDLSKFLHFIVRRILFGNYKGFFIIDSMIYVEDFPSKGNCPVTI